MISNLIEERQMRMHEAFKDITSIWPGQQLIAGPIISIPFKEYYKVEDEIKYNVRYAYFLPETLSSKVKIHPEERYRGIFKIIVYRSDIQLNGHFTKPDFSKWDVKDEDVIWDKAKLNLGINDLGGLEKGVEINWSGNNLSFEQGLVNKDFLKNGINASLSIDSFLNDKAKFSMNFNLKGSRMMEFEPLGKETEVIMEGNWADPSFKGSFLPDFREVSDSNFVAQWNVLNFNRNYPQQWLDSNSEITSSALGVDLFQSAGHYQKSERTAKYAILLISLTFLVFFLVEVVSKIKIHPFQYIMVGLALMIFYTLLLSVSEHIGFEIAYLISAILIIILVSWYSHVVFKTKGAAFQMGFTLSIFYGFMYVIVSMEDFSLLVGSIGLLIALFVLMYLTRNVDWYKRINTAEN